jgi:hypothetical protein
LLLFFAAPAIAQTSAPANAGSPNNCANHYTESVGKLYCAELDAVVDAAKPFTASAPPIPLKHLADLTANGSLIIEALAPSASARVTVESFAKSVALWEVSRVDKQSGSSSSAAASTDAVSKPSSSQLINFAFDSGALTQTANGNTVTMLANADGLFEAVTGSNRSCLNCYGIPVLKNINFSASFDLARQSGTTLTPSGSANNTSTAPATITLPKSATQLSVFTARYDLYNHLNPRSQQFQDGFKKAYAANAPTAQALGSAMLPRVNAVLNDLVGDANYLAAQDSFIQAVVAEQNGNTLTPARLENLFETYFNSVIALLHKNDPNLDQKVVDAMLALTSYSQLNHAIVQQAQGQPLLTAEYTYSRPANQPETHNVRIIYGQTFSRNQLISINTAATLYGTQLPAGAKYGRFRDFQFSGEFDRPLGDSATHPATLSFAAYGQYQFDPTVLNITQGDLAPGTNIVLPGNAQVLLGTSGWLVLLQGKVTIDIKSGLKIPVAVKWSNKTDLLNAHDVRGQVGVSYDFSSLSQVLGKQ